MASTPFRTRLQARERLLGTLVQTAHPDMARRLAAQGFDWLFLDGEHGGYGPAEATATLKGLGGAVPCLLRVPSQAPAGLEAAATCGVEGVIVPHVDTPEQAAAVVERVQGRCLVVVQAESREAVAHIQAIARVPGVDAVFVGPYDLSASLGIPEQFDHPDLLAALAAITTACRDADMPLGLFRMTAAEIRPWEPAGFTLLAVGLDGTPLEELSG